MTTDDGTTIRFGLLEPTAIDPYRAQEMMGITINKALYDGLLRLDLSGRVVPGLATRWSCDDDGRGWTFELRGDSRFSNGEIVTAGHFVHAWNRAVSTTANSETTYHMAGIVGYDERELNGGLAGVSAVNNMTLRVRLNAPDFEFDKKTLQPIFSPVTYDSGPADDPEHNAQPIGNGPLRLVAPWIRGSSELVELVPNEYYAGPRPAGVDRIQITILSPDTAAAEEVDGLQSGRFDLAGVPAGKADTDTGRFRSTRTDLAGVIYLLPFLHHGLLADRNARFAVNHGFDRDALMNGYFGGDRTIATSLIPPSLGAAHRSVPERVAYDPELARKYAADSSLRPGSVLKLVHNVEGNHEGWLRIVATQLEANLGITVELESMTSWGVVEYRTSLAATGACRAGWMTDYPTADNILFPLLHSSCTNPDETGQAHGDNEGRYADAEFDELIRRARGTIGEIDRSALYAQAEEIAVGRDMAIIPLWYSHDTRWYDPTVVDGVRIDAFGCLALDELRPAKGEAL